MKLYVRPQTKTQYPFKISRIEDSYGVKFIGDFCVKLANGAWSDFPVAVFYQANPNRELGHSNYLGIHRTQEALPQWVLSNGESAFTDGIMGVVADDGEVIYSRFRHDYVTSVDGSVFIDGGRDYLKAPLHRKIVKLVINKDNFDIEEID